MTSWKGSVWAASGWMWFMSVEGDLHGPGVATCAHACLLRTRTTGLSEYGFCWYDTKYKIIADIVDC